MRASGVAPAEDRANALVIPETCPQVRRALQCDIDFGVFQRLSNTAVAVTSSRPSFARRCSAESG
jgi:hypothetical protein